MMLNALTGTIKNTLNIAVLWRRLDLNIPTAQTVADNMRHTWHEFTSKVPVGKHHQPTPQEQGESHLVQHSPDGHANHNSHNTGTANA
jgi:hypothetical protein